MDEKAVADEPETVSKHERVGEKEKEEDPKQPRGGSDGFVSS